MKWGHRNSYLVELRSFFCFDKDAKGMLMICKGKQHQEADVCTEIYRMQWTFLDTKKLEKISSSDWVPSEF